LITRFTWPDPRIAEWHGHSTHSIGLCNALELAEQLDRLPPRVDVYGIEIRDDQAVTAMSAEVLHAVDELVPIICADVCEAVHA
jgi:hydrogenase maturation protease